MQAGADPQCIGLVPLYQSCLDIDIGWSGWRRSLYGRPRRLSAAVGGGNIGNEFTEQRRGDWGDRNLNNG